ncbi:MAG: hypothetical protein Kow0047_26190 [Anaerolineae bacterium]
MIRTHDIRLTGPRVVLRPFTEADLPTVLRWYQDPEILYLAEANDFDARSVDDIRPIYEYLSHHGYLFAIEVDGELIGEVCLERMNLDRINARYPGERIFRMPILIGERRYWGQGLGKEVVGLLLDYAFRWLSADRFYIPGVWGFNQRSLRLWRSFGFRTVDVRPVLLDRRGRIDETDEIELTLTRAEWEARREGVRG